MKNLLRRKQPKSSGEPIIAGGGWPVHRSANLPAVVVAAAVTVSVLLPACGGKQEHKLEGRPEGPYRLTLALDPEDPTPGERARLTFKLRHADSGEPVRNLQVVHERVIHNFIVSRDFRHFAHIHHEDFQPVTEKHLARATFHFPYTFPQAGRYRIVSEFTHRDRAWTKHFDLTIGQAPERVPQIDLARDKRFGPYRARIDVSPNPPIAGHPVELVLHLTRDDKPVTDLAMHLGSELHGAIWRLDGNHFGHVHSYTPRMAALMQSVSELDDPQERARRRKQLMRQLARTPREQVYEGPRIPVRHVFNAPGVYQLFLQCAPGGEPRTFDFMLEVQKKARPDVDISPESMVEPSPAETRQK